MSGSPPPTSRTCMSTAAAASVRFWGSSMTSSARASRSGCCMPRSPARGSGMISISTPPCCRGLNATSAPGCTSKPSSSMEKPPTSAAPTSPAPAWAPKARTAATLSPASSPTTPAWSPPSWSSLIKSGWVPGAAPASAATTAPTPSGDPFILYLPLRPYDDEGSVL